MTLFAIAAVAAALSATDADTGIDYTLSGRTLTVATSQSTPAAITKQMLGRRIGFVCVRIVKRDMKPTYVKRTWPAGATSMRVTLPRAVPHVYACGLENLDINRDISYGFFS